MLTKRLQSIYNLVDADSITLDVGCDHGLLSIFLRKNNKSKLSYVSDINQNALNQAISNISSHNVSKTIPILGDGTNVSCINDINTLIISGLGSDTIINILSRDISVLPNNIILCSNNNYFNIRKYLISINYFVSQETIVKDNNKYYVTIKFSKYKTNKNINLYLPNTEKNSLYFEYISYLYNQKKSIFDQIPNRLFIKKIKLYKLIKLYKKEVKKK